MTLNIDKTVLAAKIESTYNTAPTIAAANAMKIYDVSLTPLASETVSREIIRGYMGNYQQIPVAVKTELSFKTELAASGTAGTKPRIDPLLLSCGLSRADVSSTSNTYSPDATPDSSCSIKVFVDGNVHLLTGARGTFNIVGEVSNLPYIEFTFTGNYNTPSASANLSPSFGDQASPLAFASGNTSSFALHTYAGKLQTFNYSHNNAVSYRELIGSTKQILITGREPNGNVVIEDPGVAAKDYYSIVNSTNTGNLTLIHGTTAGNKVQFTAGQADLSSIAFQDLDKIRMLDIGYNAIPTDAGNDEIALKFF